jgi:hypothetical protein
LNGEIYRDDNRADIVTVGDEFLDMLENFIDFNNRNTYQNYDANSHPELSGIVYIENSESNTIDESYISNTL